MLRRLAHRFLDSVLPPPRDFAGYESLIKFIKKNQILKLEGDLVEIGTLFGGGARKLAKLLEKEKSDKKLYVVDIFDLEKDKSITAQGRAMTNIYKEILERFGPKRSQWEVFLLTTRNCPNIFTIKKDSKKAKLPTQKVCFCFIDGNHQPDYVKNDFYLIWKKLVSRGLVAFHDYNSNLPLVTKAVNQLLKRHYRQIDKTTYDPKNTILYVEKK